MNKKTKTSNTLGEHVKIVYESREAIKNGYTISYDELKKKLMRSKNNE